jgi:hypothetical protein
MAVTALVEYVPRWFWSCRLFCCRVWLLNLFISVVVVGVPATFIGAKPVSSRPWGEGVTAGIVLLWWSGPCCVPCSNVKLVVAMKAATA